MTNLRRVDRIVVHHSATARSATFEAIERVHTLPMSEGGRGFAAIAYHYVILADGSVRVGRRLPAMGAHARGANSGSIGICLIGDNTTSGERWTVEQVAALRGLVAALRVVWPGLPICGHRDVGYTECPGLDVVDLLG